MLGRGGSPVNENVRKAKINAVLWRMQGVDELACPSQLSRGRTPYVPIGADVFQFQQLIPWRGSEVGNVIPLGHSLSQQLANILGQNIQSLVRLVPHDACALTLVLALTVAVVLVAR